MKDWFINIFGGGAFDGVYDMLNTTLLGAGDYETASNFTSGIYNSVMVPFSLSLIIIYLVCNIIEKSTNEQFTYEQLFLLLAKAVVAIFIVTKGFDIMKELQDVGLDLLQSIHAAAQDLGMKIGTAGDDAALEEYIKNNEGLMEMYTYYTGATFPDEPGVFDTIMCILTKGVVLLLAYAATVILNACVYVIVFMRILEIYIRTMFAPIALSDIFGHGLNSTGFRFLKGYFAVSLQTVCIYGCILLNSVVAATISVESGYMYSQYIFILKYIGLGAATVGLMFKSQSLIKEFVGTN